MADGKVKNLRMAAVMLAGAALLLVASPRAGAQVPTAQTGGTGETAPPPTPTETAAPKAAPTTPTTPTTPKKKSRWGHKSQKDQKKAIPEVNASAEPDKLLYDRALADLKAGRYTEGRLALQTLINTYPDSEYLAKAKLSVADSYFKEGGTSNLTQSIQEYNDFQTFFPFLDEAAYAQMQIGLAHYKMMEKADRDKTQGEAAEDAFQAFLLKYPQNPLAPKAAQYLRNVQEVLADSDFKVAYFYYTKMDYRASAARLVEVSDRYPLYSQNDQALWMLGNIYERAKQVSKSEDDKNHWDDLATRCYDRIVRDYPLSKDAPGAKERLKAMGRPVPSADPDAIARMQKQQLYEKQHHQSIALTLPMGMLRGSPDVSTAARAGTPQMNPPDDAVSATDVLRPGAAGPTFTLTGSTAGGSADASGSSSEVVTPEDATTVPAGSQGAQTAVGATILTPLDDKGQPTSAAPEGTAAAPDTTGVGSGSGSATAPPASTSETLTGSGSGTASAPVATGTVSATGTNDSATSSTSSAGPAGAAPVATGTTAQPAPKASGAAKPPPVDSNEESTSKKKKGLKKLIPW
ncbi:MAG: outer membrane protein assembly factor BamD [Candidatus Acidiferrales bacterium]